MLYSQFAKLFESRKTKSFTLPYIDGEFKINIDEREIVKAYNEFKKLIQKEESLFKNAEKGGPKHYRLDPEHILFNDGKIYEEKQYYHETKEKAEELKTFIRENILDENHVLLLFPPKGEFEEFCTYGKKPLHKCIPIEDRNRNLIHFEISLDNINSLYEIKEHNKHIIKKYPFEKIIKSKNTMINNKDFAENRVIIEEKIDFNFSKYTANICLGYEVLTGNLFSDYIKKQEYYFKKNLNENLDNDYFKNLDIASILVRADTRQIYSLPIDSTVTWGHTLDTRTDYFKAEELKKDKNKLNKLISDELKKHGYEIDEEKLIDTCKSKNIVKKYGDFIIKSSINKEDDYIEKTVNELFSKNEYLKDFIAPLKDLSDIVLEIENKKLHIMIQENVENITNYNNNFALNTKTNMGRECYVFRNIMKLALCHVEGTKEMKKTKIDRKINYNLNEERLNKIKESSETSIDNKLTSKYNILKKHFNNVLNYGEEEWIHADIKYDNLKGDHILDWGNSGWGNGIYDLAKFIMHGGIHKTNIVPTEKDHKRWLSLYLSYKEICKNKEKYETSEDIKSVFFKPTYSEKEFNDAYSVLKSSMAIIKEIYETRIEIKKDKGEEIQQTQIERMDINEKINENIYLSTLINSNYSTFFSLGNVLQERFYQAN
jgi:hypothetical protein